MQLSIDKDRKTLLYLLAIGNTIAFSAWTVMLNNFAVERAAFTGDQIGVLQSLREVPGFLAFTVVLVMLFIRQQNLAILSLLLLGVGADTMTPNRLIAALLRAPVDLLWNGGIGTYVKARSESHAEVGDRANDAARIDAGELRCRVVGEGGNLGLTQLGRIEYAARGGRINSDAIDNSAGVDCSDHEVNIKILLGAAAAAGEITSGARDELLAEMTGEVAALVLRDNYLQSQAITAAQARAAASLDGDARLIRALERRGVLDRAVEYLPDEEEIAERRGEGRGLTRPEIAVLLSYAKMVLYRDLLASPLPDDPYLAADLRRYFPRPLRKRHARHIESHRLRREIIATFEANSIVNRTGPSFVSDIASGRTTVATVPSDPLEGKAHPASRTTVPDVRRPGKTFASPMKFETNCVLGVE